MVRRIRTAETDRIGDAVGATAAIVGTIALHLFMFGGDEYFALRFLLTPFGDPIAFAAFVLSLVLVLVAWVRVSRARPWAVLRGTPDDADTDRATATRGLISARAYSAAIPGAVTRRALKAAGVIAVVNSLFVIVFVIAVIPVFLTIFGVAAAMIAGMYIVLRSREGASQANMTRRRGGSV